LFKNKLIPIIILIQKDKESTYPECAMVALLLDTKSLSMRNDWKSGNIFLKAIYADFPERMYVPFCSLIIDKYHLDQFYEDGTY